MTKVKDLMVREVKTISAQESLKDAIRAMALGRFRRIPVLERGKLVGIITDRDIRMALNSPVVFRERSSDEYLLNSVSVGSSMTHAPLTISPEDTILRAAEVMEEHKIGGLPVMRDNELVGIITLSDLVNFLIRRLKEQGA